MYNGGSFTQDASGGAQQPPGSGWSNLPQQQAMQRSADPYMHHILQQQLMQQQLHRQQQLAAQHQLHSSSRANSSHNINSHTGTFLAGGSGGRYGSQPPLPPQQPQSSAQPPPPPPPSALPPGIPMENLMLPPIAVQRQERNHERRAAAMARRQEQAQREERQRQEEKAALDLFSRPEKVDAPDDDGHASAIKRVLGEHDQALRMLNSKSSCIGIDYQPPTPAPTQHHHIIGGEDDDEVDTAAAGTTASASNSSYNEFSNRQHQRQQHPQFAQPFNNGGNNSSSMHYQQQQQQQLRAQQHYQQQRQQQQQSMLPPPTSDGHRNNFPSHASTSGSATSSMPPPTSMQHAGFRHQQPSSAADPPPPLAPTSAEQRARIPSLMSTKTALPGGGGPSMSQSRGGRGDFIEPSAPRPSNKTQNRPSPYNQQRPMDYSSSSSSSNGGGGGLSSSTNSSAPTHQQLQNHPETSSASSHHHHQNRLKEAGQKLPKVNTTAELTELLKEFKNPLGSASSMPPPLSAIITPRAPEHEGNVRANPPKYFGMGSSGGSSVLQSLGLGLSSDLLPAVLGPLDANLSEDSDKEDPSTPQKAELTASNPNKSSPFENLKNSQQNHHPQRTLSQLTNDSTNKDGTTTTTDSSSDDSSSDDELKASTKKSSSSKKPKDHQNSTAKNLLPTISTNPCLNLSSEDEAEDETTTKRSFEEKDEEEDNAFSLNALISKVKSAPSPGQPKPPSKHEQPEMLIPSTCLEDDDDDEVTVGDMNVVDEEGISGLLSHTPQQIPDFDAADDTASPFDATGAPPGLKPLSPMLSPLGSPIKSLGSVHSNPSSVPPQLEEPQQQEEQLQQPQPLPVVPAASPAPSNSSRKSSKKKSSSKSKSSPSASGTNANTTNLSPASSWASRLSSPAQHRRHSSRQTTPRQAAVIDGLSSSDEEYSESSQSQREQRPRKPPKKSKPSPRVSASPRIVQQSPQRRKSPSSSHSGRDRTISQSSANNIGSPFSSSASPRSRPKGPKKSALASPAVSTNSSKQIDENDSEFDLGLDDVAPVSKVKKKKDLYGGRIVEPGKYISNMKDVRVLLDRSDVHNSGSSPEKTPREVAKANQNHKPAEAVASASPSVSKRASSASKQKEKEDSSFTENEGGSSPPRQPPVKKNQALSSIFKSKAAGSSGGKGKGTKKTGGKAGIKVELKTEDEQKEEDNLRSRLNRRKDGRPLLPVALNLALFPPTLFKKASGAIVSQGQGQQQPSSYSQGYAGIKGIKTKASRESSSGSTSDDVAVADENKNSNANQAQESWKNNRKRKASECITVESASAKPSTSASASTSASNNDESKPEAKKARREESASTEANSPPSSEGSASLMPPPQRVFWSYIEQRQRDVDADNEAAAAGESQFNVMLQAVLTEAKKLKHDADRESDAKIKSIKYLRSILLFCKSAAMHESKGDFISAFSLYDETKGLVKFLCNLHRKQPLTNIDTKLRVLQLRCYSLVCLKLYKLRKNEFSQCQKLINDYIEKSKLNPQIHNNTNSNQENNSPKNQHVISPTPSPAGSEGSVCSKSSGYNSSGEGTNSGCGRSGGVLTPPTTSSTSNHPPPTPNENVLSLPKKLVENQHTYAFYLSEAHELWEMADGLVSRGRCEDFIIRLDQECGPLTLHSSIRDLVNYSKTGLEILNPMPPEKQREAGSRSRNATGGSSTSSSSSRGGKDLGKSKSKSSKSKMKL